MKPICEGCIRHPNCSKYWVDLYDGDCPFVNNIHDPAFIAWRKEHDLYLEYWDHSEEKKRRAGEGRRKAMEARKVG